MENRWQLLDEEKTASPALIYYQGVIEENTRLALSVAGGAERLWPHVKTHKMARIVQYLQGLGVNRFKCATIGEAEMLAACGVAHVLVAYPLVGPNIGRFIELRQRFAATTFWAIGDSLRQLALLGRETKTLVDVNMGMNRTGVAPDALEEFCLLCADLPGISLQGLHCYDGNFAIPDLGERERRVKEKVEEVLLVREAVEAAGQPLPVMVMGGTPTFPCHARLHDFYLSPGTLFVHDDGYRVKFPDLGFTPGAALLTRVVSHTAEGLFTLDLGYKAISTDQSTAPGVIVGLPRAKAVGQSEEHWLFDAGGGDVPPIGSVLYVLPAHICPTTALHPFAHVARQGRIVDRWHVTARDRKITI